MIYWIGYLLILILGGGSLIALLNHLQRARKSSVLINLSLMLLSLFLTCMALEFYFKNFFAEPDTFNTLARQNWKRWYYEGSLNSLGYRDVEWTDEKVAGKIKVMVAGDSFVYGAATARLEDRFPDQLAKKLGPAFVVFNISQNGWDTGQVIEAITKYPYRPDILVFSYYINDIESVSALCPHTPNPFNPVPPALAPLIENSYAANFFYWRSGRLIQAWQPDIRGDCFFKAYNDPKTWWLYQQELLSVYEGTKSEQIPLFVVVFPDLFHVEESVAATGRVVNLYREKSVPIVDVSDLVKNLPPQQRVASPVESHAGIWVNKLVAEALYDKFKEMNLVK